MEKKDTSHKRLSAVGPIRTPEKRRGNGHPTPLVTNAFRLLVRSGLAAVAVGVPVALDESQTPFGCWSDQDVAEYATYKSLNDAVSQTPFGCWSDQDVTRNGPPLRRRSLRSQTPFGCWSDQDLTETRGGYIYKSTVVTNAFRLLVRSGRTEQIVTAAELIPVTNAFRLLVRSGHAA